MVRSSRTKLCPIENFGVVPMFVIVTEIFWPGEASNAVTSITHFVVGLNFHFFWRRFWCARATGEEPEKCAATKGNRCDYLNNCFSHALKLERREKSRLDADQGFCRFFLEGNPTSISILPMQKILLSSLCSSRLTRLWALLPTRTKEPTITIRAESCGDFRRTDQQLKFSTKIFPASCRP